MNILSTKMVEVIVLQKEDYLKDIGRKGYLIGKEESLLRMKLFMKEILKMVNLMDMVHVHGLMDKNM